MKTIAIFCFAMAAASPASAGEHVCRASQHRIGPCKTIHAAVALSADAGFVIRESGHRAYSVVPPPKSDWDMPKSLLDVFDKELNGMVEGDFLVCPVPKLVSPDLVPGAYCIERARHLRSIKR